MKKIFFLFCIPMLSFSQLEKPYQLSWKKDLSIAAGLAVSSSISIYLSNNSVGLSEHEISLLDASKINALDRLAIERYDLNLVKTSEYFMYGSLALPALMLLDKNAQKDFLTLGVIGAEGLLLAYNIRTLTKVIVRRPKPFMYRNDVPLSKKMEAESRHSFVSGHATFAFFGAALLTKFYSDYHPESQSRYWVAVGSYSLATAAALYRTASGVHFATDVLAGALVGVSSAYFITYLHQNQQKNLSFNLTGQGAHVHWRF